MNSQIKEKILNHFKTKAELARFLGISRQHVNHWFNGGKQMDVKSALRVADVIGIDWMEIREDMRL